MTESNSMFPEGSPHDPNQEEDLALISFLRTNAPSVPEASPGLEAQLMQSIQQQNHSPSSAQPQQTQTRHWLGWRGAILIGMGGAVAALALTQLQQLLSPPGLSTAQLAELEAFMVSSWDDTVPLNEPLVEWDVLGRRTQPADPLAALDPVTTNASLSVDLEP